jgi:ribonuclease-3
VTSAASALAVRLGLDFDDPSLLEQALVHSSYEHEHPEPGLVANERLEFLGDAVVSLIVSEALWGRHPGEPEGGLTTRRAAIVSTRGLAAIATRLELGEAVRLGEGASRSGERRRSSVLAGALEALVAAIYLDKGLDTARECFLEWAEPELTAQGGLAEKPPKSILQEHAYATTGRPPVYQVMRAEGPDHAKHYLVAVSMEGEELGRGEGRNRRDAETEAARQALGRLRVS